MASWCDKQLQVPSLGSFSARELVSHFVEESREAIRHLYLAARSHKGIDELQPDFYTFEGAQRKPFHAPAGCFFLRTSTEYSNPQLALFDLQGILTSRLLESTASFMLAHESSEISSEDYAEILEKLAAPSSGLITPFLLNTDESEPDRYSMNPFRESIVASGQSAFPSFNVKMNGLMLDPNFVSKYKGTLIDESEAGWLDDARSQFPSDVYTDFIDSVKYQQLQTLSEQTGIHLSIPAMRMPLTRMKDEVYGKYLKRIIELEHRDYETLRRMYRLMGRNLRKHKTLLLTVPHSPKGAASKKAGRGRLNLDGEKFTGITVQYTTTPLYPNEIDPADTAIAKVEEEIHVESSRILNYDFDVTPSSMQFAIYGMLSPEDAAIWHGIGEFQGEEIVKSYISVHEACVTEQLFTEIPIPCRGTPIQFDLDGANLMRHPAHGNTDASIGTVPDLGALITKTTRLDVLPVENYIRTIDET